MRFFSLLLSAFLLAGCAAGQVVVSTDTLLEPREPEPVGIILLAGQSNMEGKGNFEALSDDDKLRVAQAGLTVLFTRSLAEPIPLTFTRGRDRGDKYGFTSFFGPELFLGVELAERHPRKRYIFLKTSRGGTALYGAWNPDWSADKAAEVERAGEKRTVQLFQNHLRQVRQTTARLEASGTPYRIEGVFWLQGENDAGKEVSARSYEDNLRNLIASYRRELDSPDLPFVIGQINSRYGRFREEGPAIVRAAMETVADDTANTAIIRTVASPPWDDFPKHDDNVHYNTAGQIAWGTAFAQAYASLRDENP